MLISNGMVFFRKYLIILAFKIWFPVSEYISRKRKPPPHNIDAGSALLTPKKRIRTERKKRESHRREELF
ncbi:MAG: hypothetical protein DRP87_16425 [Spirochaetes bacterium]|nr:MAG: hypothetical protein DRP87_16425 [Spirochaetota bacterium]